MSSTLLDRPSVSASPKSLPLEVRPLTPVIGAEILGVDLRKALEPAALAQIRAALAKWRVLFFRDQDISDGQQLAFGRAFGPLTPAHLP